MTCIVGLVDKEKQRVIIGSDSASVNSDMIIARTDTSKLFKKGDFLFGCAGDFRLMQILQYSFQMPEYEEKEQDLMEYLCTSFATELMQCYEDNGSGLKYDDGQRKSSVLLLGYKARLFRMDSDFHFGESVNGYYATGCGERFAYGALEALKDTKSMSAKAKVLKALEVSEKFSTGVVRPFLIDST